MTLNALLPKEDVAKPHLPSVNSVSLHAVKSIVQEKELYFMEAYFSENPLNKEGVHVAYNP